MKTLSAFLLVLVFIAAPLEAKKVKTPKSRSAKAYHTRKAGKVKLRKPSKVAKRNRIN